MKLVTEAIFVIMNKDDVIDRKDLSNWTHVKEEIFNTNSDSFAKMLAFNKEEGLKPIQNKNLMRIFRNPDFVMGSFNDSNVRNEDPASPGSALAVAPPMHVGQCSNATVTVRTEYTLAHLHTRYTTRYSSQYSMLA